MVIIIIIIIKYIYIAGPELWPRDCLAKGYYSRRMATYCGHSNAPAEYALKKKKIGKRLQMRWFCFKHFAKEQVLFVGVGEITILAYE